MNHPIPSVLLVDDVEANLVALEGVLGSLPCQLIRASSGYEGLKHLLKGGFAVMLLDVQMPKMDGYEMARLARGNPSTRDVPIIFLTAQHQTEEHLLQGYGSGAVDILFKPISSIILRSKVRVFLDLYNSRRRIADGLEAQRQTLLELQASRDELEQRHRALEQAQREHRELTEFIVHDIKSPLTAVCSGLELAQSEIPTSQSDLAGAIADASEGAARVRSMIEDLLTISRMEQSDFPLQREALSVTKLLRSVIKGYVRRAHERGIDLAAPPEVLLEISADGTLMRRVFENILDNAFRYTPARGRIAVTVSAAAGVEINVSNDGPAIPAGERERIFEKFRRGDGDRNTSGNAGLGLYFCKRAVEAHGGGIDVLETQEWPTSFRINLPAASRDNDGARTPKP